mgnify:CR=1 FL=1
MQKISKKALQAAMSSDVEDTYNMISVDGDTSTNDTALLLANGMAGNEKIKEGTPEFDAFKEALHYVNETLAKAMAGDGEGATALFEVKVVGAQTKEQAKGSCKICCMLESYKGCDRRTRCKLGEESFVQWDIPEHSLIRSR